MTTTPVTHLSKKIIAASIGAALLTSVALPAFAAGSSDDDRNGRHERRGAMIEQILNKVDSDGDGKVTLEEAQEHHAEMFAGIDADSDGSVSRDEMRDWHKSRAEDRRAEVFAKADKDGDGSLSLEEFSELRESRGGKGRGMHHGMRKGHHGERGDRAERRDDEGRRGDHADRKQAMHGKKDGKRGGGFARLDKDGNGSVSAEEFSARGERMFARMDRNDDGVIDQSDFMRKSRGSAAETTTPAPEKAE
ncbi:EF-hand domain-containing protein [Pseudohoeflea coraliihabitans]|uniref:EF-hand domain-containing protein n=1 Tax=Pseudohoeflea coraliihabitans TaxID=2860393 RepID=A0ABS6WRA4_9HYPH|nr:EF-hand domain-containing protein [Pseudohoeflea sp. DP4N28-3]MBW3097574.1 EF-hand domain-containing protein [Pseudohoeflea sp. DP4N28-3]